MYKTPKVKKNQDKNPYLKALEEGENWLRGMRENPSPSFAPHQISLQALNFLYCFLEDERLIIQEKRERGKEKKNL